MFGKIKSNPSCQFYSLTKDEIKNNESKLGIIFPKLLREFYLEIGYGFIGSEVGNINRIMDPDKMILNFIRILKYMMNLKKIK